MPYDPTPNRRRRRKRTLTPPIKFKTVRTNKPAAAPKPTVKVKKPRRPYGQLPSLLRAYLIANPAASSNEAADYLGVSLSHIGTAARYHGIVIGSTYKRRGVGGLYRVYVPFKVIREYYVYAETKENARELVGAHNHNTAELVRHVPPSKLIKLMKRAKDKRNILTIPPVYATIIDRIPKPQGLASRGSEAGNAQGGGTSPSVCVLNGEVGR